MSEQPEVLVKFKVPDPEPEVYPYSCIKENGRPVILIRATNALAINSPKAKQLATKAQAHVPGYQNSGMEQLGGAYCIDTQSGEFLQNPPHVKEGEPLPAVMRYERKFRLNPTL